jgi:hypothetical protein
LLGGAAAWLWWRGRRLRRNFDAGISANKVGWSSCFSACWRHIGKQIGVARRSRPWWAPSGVTATSSVNKRFLQLLHLLLLLGVLLAGRGSEGQDTDGDKESVAAGKSRAATSSFHTVAKGWSSTLFGLDLGVHQRRTDAGGHRRLASASYGRKAIKQWKNCVTNLWRLGCVEKLSLMICPADLVSGLADPGDRLCSRRPLHGRHATARVPSQRTRHRHPDDILHILTDSWVQGSMLARARAPEWW